MNQAGELKARAVAGRHSASVYQMALLVLVIIAIITVRFNLSMAERLLGFDSDLAITVCIHHTMHNMSVIN